MEKIWLNKELVTENNLSVDGVLTYVALRSIYNMNNTTDCISINRLAFSILGNVNYTNALKKSLENGINELNECGYISIVNDLSVAKSKEYILDLSKLHIDTKEQFFIIIGLNEIRKIFNIDCDMSKKIRLLKYYIALVGTFNNSNDNTIFEEDIKGKVGTMTQEYISKQADCSIKSCQRYNELLIENNIIYIHKSNDYIVEENEDNGRTEVKQISNCYSRYEDKDLCEKYAINYEMYRGTNTKIIYSEKKKEMANKNRGLAQIYYHISNGKTNYTNEKIKEVYLYVHNKNKELNKLAEESKSCGNDGEYYYKQIRDENVFKQFEFLN